jgi:hypothetical protein
MDLEVERDLGQVGAVAAVGAMATPNTRIIAATSITIPARIHAGFVAIAYPAREHCATPDFM